MILSTSKQFIFIHIPKTAGRSVMDALKPFSRDYEKTVLRRFSRRLPIRESPEKVHFRGHETASAMIRKLGREKFDAFKTFAFVRNPFTHAVSQYEYMKQYRLKGLAAKIGAMSFEEYLRYRHQGLSWNDNLFARLPDQSHFIVDEYGNIAVDNVLRFERLAEEFQQIAEHLGLEGTKLRYINKTKAEKRPLESYYDNTCLKLMLEIYGRDFDNFGYDKSQFG